MIYMFGLKYCTSGAVARKDLAVLQFFLRRSYLGSGRFLELFRACELTAGKNGAGARHVVMYTSALLERVISIQIDI